MRQIDREGIFRAVPREWWIRTTTNSMAIAVSIDSDIVAQFNGADWDDWSGYEQHTVIGDWWVIGKDGGVNLRAVEQLASSIGWDGNLDNLQTRPPRVLVQLVVKPDIYQGKTRYKASWMNPGDFTPRSGASPEEVTKLSSQFGSLLRAAAAGAAKIAKPVPAPAKTVESAGPDPQSTEDDSLPF